MRKQCSGVIAAAVVAFTTSLAAQGQSPANVPPADVNAPPGAQKSEPAPAAQTRAPNTITVSGCLENAPATTAAAPGASAGATAFVLANPQMTAGGRTTGGAVGTAGVDSRGGYRLEGDQKMLSPHLNHQVRITGMLQSSAASAAGAGRPNAATLKVDKVEMVAATCEPAAASAPRSQPAQPATPAVPAQPGLPGRPDPAPTDKP